MGKGKQKKFKAVASFKNVHEGNPIDNRQRDINWIKNIFTKQQPLILELACGGGEYTLALAQKFPNKNFIGIDIKGARIYTGAKKALEDKIDNVGFLRTFIDHITDYFEPQSIEEIWITFPDPFLRKSKKNKRLTSPRFLSYYKEILKPNGIIHLKTDSDVLFDFTLETIETEKCQIIDLIPDVYAPFAERDDIFMETASTKMSSLEILQNIQTKYEKMHLADNRVIKYVSFRL